MSRPSAAGRLADREVIFEFIAVGEVLRIAAVDVETGVEVTVAAPAGASQADAEQVAAGKLAWRLEQLGEIPPEDDTKKPRPGGRGWIA